MRLWLRLPFLKSSFNFAGYSSLVRAMEFCIRQSTWEALMSIGIVISTKFSGAIRDKFLSGLRKTGWEGNPGAISGSNSRVAI